MAFDFGGPVMSQTVSDETAAQRENRDVEQMGVENKFTAQNGSVRDGSSGVATTVAAGATGGRKDRDYLERGGDVSLAYNPDDWSNPTVTSDADGRNDREYVDRATGVSALSGAKGDLFDEAANNTGLYPF